MKYVSVNGRVACQPFENVGVGKQVYGQGTFVTGKYKNNLLETSVVFGSDKFAVGTVVFVDSARLAAHEWTRAVYEVGGQKFILVPENEILLVKDVK